jgi:DNA polymerase I-like protein with 3'-5' exonuclease and polymerase domains
MIKEKKIKKKTVPKFERDLLEYVNRTPGQLLVPGNQSPLCAKCGLDKCGAYNPYLQPSAPEQPPLLTIIVDSVSKGEDQANELGIHGTSGLLRKLVADIAVEIKLDVSRVRLVPLTMCASRAAKKINYKTKGNWCRWHAVQDLVENPPGMVMAIGTTVLGALSHKSNAQDWSGRLLTWRGWPDDWIVNSKFENGHYLFGDRPTKDDRIPLYALQAPRIVYSTQNPRVIKKWRDQLRAGLELAVKGVEPLDYNRPWWRISCDADDIEATLNTIPDGALVQHDTETTGLEPYRKGAKIVFHMFRWKDKDGSVKSIGFPWDYPESPIISAIARLTPVVLQTLYRTFREGHNYSFDNLQCHGTMGGDLNKLCDSMGGDTLHMLYTARQDTGSRGLEIIAYDWAPTLAGYEEEMVMLIDQYPERLDPASGTGGHYALCPADKWDTHLKPYVMGDVEVVGEASPAIRTKLVGARTYQIPLAHNAMRDKFRWFGPPKRDWIYDNIMLPSQRTLTAMMGRGMFIDQNELAVLEDVVPKATLAAKEKLKSSNPKIIQWVEQMEATEKDWSFDLESKDQLKTILYDIMNLPVVRLTKAGRQTLGDMTKEDMAKRDKNELLEFASTDKFTLNSLAVIHEDVRPLLEYRKQFKTYTTYVRSMRNHFNPLVDKTHRKTSPYLMDDSCVHPTFNQVGTRSGRLSSCLPLDVIVATDRGLIRFGDIKVGDLIQSDTGAHPVKTVWDLTTKVELQIATGTGKKLRCSPDHEIFTSKGKIRAGNLVVGDNIWYNPAPAHFPTEYVRLDPVTVTGKPRTPFTTPDVLDESVAFVLGHFSAEGFISHFKSRPSVNSGKGGNQHTRYKGKINYSNKYAGIDRFPLRASTCVGDTEIELGNFVKSEWARLFGVVPKERKLPGTISYCVTSMGVSQWFINLKIDGLSHARRVPPAIFKSPETVIRAYLRGLFEGDGCAINGISLVTYSGGMAEDVSLLLDALGIRHFTRSSKLDVSRYKTTRHGTHRHVLTVVNMDRHKAADLFWSSKKKEEAGKSVSIATALTAQWDASGAYLDGVESIEMRESVPMIDIEVDNENHRFCVSGLLVSNSRPNAQQIPRESLVKQMYTSRFGNEGCLYQNDLSQIELRLIACACGDPSMVDAFCRGVDLHSLTANKVFKTKYEEFEKTYMEWLQKNGREKEAKELDRKRKVAKIVNFLTGYGGGPLGLQTSLAQGNVYLTQEECEEIIETFFDAYPALRRHIGLYKDFILKHGVAVSIFGRVRVFEEVFGDDREAKAKALRSGYNHLIQSTASDMMLICITIIEKLMRDANLESMLVSTVHDSLLIDAKRHELPQIHSICDQILNNMPEVLKLFFGESYDTSWLIVPITADAEVGPNYLDQRKVSGSNPDWDALLNAKTH